MKDKTPEQQDPTTAKIILPHNKITTLLEGTEIRGPVYIEDTHGNSVLVNSNITISKGGANIFFGEDNKLHFLTTEVPITGGDTVDTAENV